MAANIRLTLGEDTAVVSPTGAALVEYTVGDRPVVVSMNAFDGAVLAPWPNRIADGRFEFNGHRHQLPITEPARNTALHGLVAQTDWQVTASDDSSVSLNTTIPSSEGYPFELILDAKYSLSDDGIIVRARAQNPGSHSVPFGFGFHPWFHPGSAEIDQSQLSLPAETWFETDERLIPVEEKPFDTGSLIPTDHEHDETPCIVCKDFRSLRTVASTVLDDAFGSPQRGADGWSRARLKGADGRTIQVGMDEHFRTWQVCTGDELPGERRRRAIAIEPMTCAPNAFATGADFDVIDPHDELSVEWTIGLH